MHKWWAGAGTAFGCHPPSGHFKERKRDRDKDRLFVLYKVVCLWGVQRSSAGGVQSLDDLLDLPLISRLAVKIVEEKLNQLVYAVVEGANLGHWHADTLMHRCMPLTNWHEALLPLEH